MGDVEDDPIKKLLEQSGWSYSEVLKKLETYKKLCIDTNTSENVNCTTDNNTNQIHDEHDYYGVNGHSNNNVAENKFQHTIVNNEHKTNNVEDQIEMQHLEITIDCKECNSIGDNNSDDEHNYIIQGNVISKTTVKIEENCEYSLEPIQNGYIKDEVEINEDDVKATPKQEDAILERDQDRIIEDDTVEYHIQTNITQNEQRISIENCAKKKQISENSEQNILDDDDKLTNESKIALFQDTNEQNIILIRYDEETNSLVPVDDIVNVKHRLMDVQNTEDVEDSRKDDQKQILNKTLDNEMDWVSVKTDQAGNCLIENQNENCNLGNILEKRNDLIETSDLNFRQIKKGNYSVLNKNRLRILGKYKNRKRRLLKKPINRKTSSPEELRSKLKAQLELLRNNRMTSNLITKTRNFKNPKTFFKHNKTRLNDICSNLRQKLRENSYNMDRMKFLTENTNILSSSNESDLMIVNVVGGYKSPPPEIDVNVGDTEDRDNKENESQTELSAEEGCSHETSIIRNFLNQNCSDKNKQPESNLRVERQPSPVLGNADSVAVIKPTKTTDVTKIKGWKKKKFAIPTTTKEKPSVAVLSKDVLNNTSETNSKHPSPTSVTNESQSANVNALNSIFCSSALDQFLTENRDLKLDYEVPTLNTEQAVTKKVMDIEMPKVRPIYKPPPKTKKIPKPKTLAEKRRMLLQSQQQQLAMGNPSEVKKQRKQYERSMLTMRQKNAPFKRSYYIAATNATKSHSYVIYNGKKYKVASRNKKKIVAEIKDSRRIRRYVQYKPHLNKSHEETIKKNPLLNTLNSEKCNPSFSPHRVSVTRKLPKLYLELTPELGKRVPPEVEHLIQAKDDFILDEKRIDFALSALLNVSESTKKTFTFPISYVNEHQGVILKEIPPECSDTLVPEKSSRAVETDEDIKKSVTSVLNKLLDYVEVSEIQHDLIKDDSDSYVENGSDSNKKSTKQAFKIKKMPKLKPIHAVKRLNKTELEMRRLNCKIVSVSLEEENVETYPCQREFCRLGCICRSIECNQTNVLSDHCGLAECMFNCTCKMKKRSTEQSVCLPAGTDLFSEGVMNRLQDEAKKNLAKVEKEFTPVAIQTNHQFIVIDGSKSRRRRATKVPKKYYDFIEEDPETLEPEYTKEITKKKIDNQSLIDDCLNRDCSVKLIKHDLHDLIPFCMVHLLYKCYCKYEAVYDERRTAYSSRGHFTQFPYSSLFASFRNRCPVKPSATENQFDTELYCCRTRGLTSSYYTTRNKTRYHKRMIRRISNHFFAVLRDYLREHAPKYKGKKKSKKKETVEQKGKTRGIKRKRKEPSDVPTNEECNVEVLESNETNAATETDQREKKIQRRRKTKKNSRKVQDDGTNSNNDACPVATSHLAALPMLDDDISFDNNENNEKQFRLLSWSKLASRFENGTFQVWYSPAPKKGAHLLITENGRRPSVSYCNIKEFVYVSQEKTIPAEIVRCLVNKTIPMGKPVDEISLMLTFKSFWEVCGICEKKMDANYKPNSNVSVVLDNCNNLRVHIPVNNNIVESIQTNNLIPSANVSTDDTEASTTLNCKKVMYCTNRRYQPKKLLSSPCHTDILKTRQVLWASVPSVMANCRWRVVCMNNNFTYLCLSRCNCTIRYKDIVRAINVAQAGQTTIVLKSPELLQKYTHRMFGIYCAHNYSDKVFIGPYYDNESHDLDTLSLIGDVVINTNLLSQSTNSPQDSGLWFYQPSADEEHPIGDDDANVLPAGASNTTIDLTCDSDDELSALNEQLNGEEDSNQQIIGDIPIVHHTNDNDNQDDTAQTRKLLESGKLKSLLKSNNPLLGKTQNNTQENNKIASEIVNKLEKMFKEDKDETLNDQQSRTSVASKSEKIIYFLTNIPDAGYIIGYKTVNSSITDVVCPITQRRKSFPSSEIARVGLQRVLLKRFIFVPPTFEIKVSVFSEMKDTQIRPLDRTILNGYHIAGAFGIKNIIDSTPRELYEMGLDPLCVKHIILTREKKLLFPTLTELGKLLTVPIDMDTLFETVKVVIRMAVSEIRSLASINSARIKEKIDLESKKVALVERYSKLTCNLPTHLRQSYQQLLDDTLNYNSQENNSSVKTQNVLKEKSKPISMDVDDDNVNCILTNENSTAMKTVDSSTVAVPTTSRGITRSGTNKIVQNDSNNILTKPVKIISKATDASGKKFVILSQKKPTARVEKRTSNVLKVVKEVPMTVKKDLINTINSSILQQKSFLEKKATGSATPPLHYNVCQKIVKPVSFTTAIATTSSPIIIPTCSLPPLKMPSLIPMVNVKNQVVPIKLVSEPARAPTPRQSVILNQSAVSPNYIVVKDNGGIKRFHVVHSPKNAPILQTMVARKCDGVIPVFHKPGPN